MSPFRAAVVVLDLRSGAVRVRCFHEADPVALPFHLVALAYVDVALVEDIERRHGEGCVLQPSLELLEEAAAREAEADGVGVSWALLEAQLRLSYDDFDPDEYDHERHRAGEHGEGRGRLGRGRLGRGLLPTKPGTRPYVAREAPTSECYIRSRAEPNEKGRACL